MSKRIHEHLRSNVVGYVAIFLFAVGGTAYATHPGGTNTISTGDIINGEVKSADVGDGEVRNADLAADAVGSGKIQDRQVKNADLGLGASSSNTIADGGVQGIDVANDSLNDEDLGHSLVDFSGNLGTVPAHECVDLFVSGVDAQGDHLLVTPTASSQLIYSAEYSTVGEHMIIQACNPLNSAVNEGTTQFNLLVIDAQ